MAEVMPVSDSMKGGMRASGLTSWLHLAMNLPFSTSTRPISVMRSLVGVAPVVSRSRNTREFSNISYAINSTIGWIVSHLAVERNEALNPGVFEPRAGSASMRICKP